MALLALPPAACTSTSIRPNAATARSIARSTLAESVTLQATAIARPPASSLSRTVRIAVSSFRSHTATHAPSFASIFAIVPPI